MEVRRKPVPDSFTRRKASQSGHHQDGSVQHRPAKAHRPRFEEHSSSTFEDLNAQMQDLCILQEAQAVENATHSSRMTEDAMKLSYTTAFQKLDHCNTSESLYHDLSSSTSDAFFEAAVFITSHDDSYNKSFTPPTEMNSSSQLTTTSTVSSETSTLSNRTEKLKTRINSGFEETSVFLGGLIQTPIEFRKHYSVLRHSYGWVYYKGPETSVAITIFADRPLPPGRRVWVQVKGWTGRAGMTTKAFLHQNKSWVDVTPDRLIEAKNLRTVDERAWQRDIRNFQQRAPQALRNHTVRETLVIRIPIECTDGYFRAVITEADSKSILCPSPVFRIASTSTSSASFKGASLKTLPLELSIKMAQTATTVYTKAVAAPMLSVVQAKLSSGIPLQYAGTAKTAFEFSGVETKIGSTINRAQDFHPDSIQKVKEYSQFVADEATPLSMIVGDVAGPSAPFPLRVRTTIRPGSGLSRVEFGLPTANLNDIPSDLIGPLNCGVYIGFARVVLNKKVEIDFEPQWEYAIIYVVRDSCKEASVAPRKVLRVYLIQSYPSHLTFVGCKMEVIISEWLRPPLPENNREMVIQETVLDIDIVRNSLNREEWCLERTLLRLKLWNEALSNKYLSAKTLGHRYINETPMHKIGLRHRSLASHDRGLYGNGGIFIKRD